MISFCNQDISSREYNEFTVLYDLRNKMILKLESVAADIWHYIYENNNVTFQEIVDYIVSIYDCDGEAVADDVEAFLEDLFSSGIIMIDNKYVDVIEEADIDISTQKEIDDFEGIIIQELQEQNQLYSVTFEMTYACNERCVHCYAHDDSSNMVTERIPAEKYKEVLDQLYDMKCMHIAFTGGDPFMYKDFLDVYRYARKKGFVCDLFTNALYLENHKSVMDEIITSRPRALYISLYGSNPTTHDSVTRVKGSFDKTISAVRELKAAGISVVFNVMIMTTNHHELDEIISLANKLGAEYRVSMSLIYTNAGSDSPMNYFVNDKMVIKRVLGTVRQNMYSFDVAIDDIEPGEYMCSAGVTSLSIAPDGTVYPCISLKNPLGNIQENTIDEVWKSHKRVEVMDSLRWENTKECKMCKYQLSCPHCPGISQAETGDCFSCNTCDRIIAECLAEE